jgi:hypothetical protein
VCKYPHEFDITRDIYRKDVSYKLQRVISRRKGNINIKIQISAEDIHYIELINVDFRAFVKTVTKLKVL